MEVAACASSVSATARTHRVLVVDDNPAIHQDLSKILCAGALDPPALTRLEAELFERAPLPASDCYMLTCAHQGRAAVELVADALRRHERFAMAFVDVRMPPGWDGLETVEQLWRIAPDLQIVLCTAYADYSWSEIDARLGGRGGLFILKKPFDPIEVLQLASSLTRRWAADCDHAELVDLQRVRDEMSTMLVHDLQNPLAALLSSIDFVADVLPVAPPEVLSALDDSRTASRRMRRLLDNLLTIANVEGGRLRLCRAPVSLEGLLSESWRSGARWRAAAASSSGSARSRTPSPRSTRSSSRARWRTSSTTASATPREAVRSSFTSRSATAARASRSATPARPSPPRSARRSSRSSRAAPARRAA